MPFDPISYSRASESGLTWSDVRVKLETEGSRNKYYDSLESLVKKLTQETVTQTIQILELKAQANATTKDYYAVVADLVTDDSLYGVYNTLEGVTFDNDGGGTWTKAIKLSLAAATTEDAQYKIVIDATTLKVYSADGTEKFSDTLPSAFWSSVKDDGKDIRLFDQNYNPLYFWFEEWDYANQTATIWVRLAAGSTELNIAYGNSLAIQSAYEDGEQVFEFFDDFEGDSLDIVKWTANYVNTVYYEVVNSNLRITDATKNGNTYWIYNNTDTGSQIKANFTVLDKMLVYWKQKMEVQSSASQLGEVGVGLCKVDKTIEVYTLQEDGSTGSRLYATGTSDTFINGDNYSTTHDITANTYYNMYIFKDGQNYTIRVEDLNENLIFEFSGTSTAVIDYVAICVGAYGGYAFSTMDIDLIYIAKLTDPANFTSLTDATLDVQTTNFDFPDGIDKLLVIQDGDKTIYYSTDNGETWTQATEGEEIEFAATATQIKLKFEGGTSFRGYSFLVW